MAEPHALADAASVPASGTTPWPTQGPEADKEFERGGEGGGGFSGLASLRSCEVAWKHHDVTIFLDIVLARFKDFRGPHIPINVKRYKKMPARVKRKTA